MMYSCDESNDLLQAFLTLTCPSAYYMLYRNMSIYCNTLCAIYRYGKIHIVPALTFTMKSHEVCTSLTASNYKQFPTLGNK